MRRRRGYPQLLIQRTTIAVVVAEVVVAGVGEEVHLAEDLLGAPLPRGTRPVST